MDQPGHVCPQAQRFPPSAVGAAVLILGYELCTERYATTPAPTQAHPSSRVTHVPHHFHAVKPTGMLSLLHAWGDWISLKHDVQRLLLPHKQVSFCVQLAGSCSTLLPASPTPTLSLFEPVHFCLRNLLKSAFAEIARLMAD